MQLALHFNVAGCQIIGSSTACSHQVHQYSAKESSMFPLFNVYFQILERHYSLLTNCMKFLLYNSGTEEVYPPKIIFSIFYSECFRFLLFLTADFTIKMCLLTIYIFFPVAFTLRTKMSLEVNTFGICLFVLPLHFLAY